jgi:hypothetical protein
VRVLGIGRRPRLWMQDRNLKEEDYFENTYVALLECAATLLYLIQVGFWGIGQCDAVSSRLFLFWYNSI